MKIGLVIDRFDPAKGGAERALTELARAATAAGHEVLAFSMRAGEDAPARVVRIRVPPSPRGVRDVTFGRRAVAAARAERCDVVLGVRHVTGVDVYWPHGGVHAATLAAVERSKGRIGGALSRALHRTSPKQRALLAVERRFFADPGRARIWCVADLVRREILARWPRCADALEIHGNAVDCDHFHPGLRKEHRDRLRRELRIADGVPMLLFLGGAWRLKGFPVLLEALGRLRRDRWTCVAAGTRDDAARRAVERSGLGGRVLVLPHGDPRRLYGAADLLVQPTWRDPCSLATLEALACGVPVVTTDANGAAGGDRSDAVTAVPAGDAEAFAQAVRSRLSLVADERAAGKLRRAARDAAPGLDAWRREALEALARAATSSAG